MPSNSFILGVDLAPIKPIPRVVTFQGDITTDKCRVQIRHYLKSWKPDTVLHDGAPNLGIAWVQDAFSQAELALQALKLATLFLSEGGTFVTKVFRSKDYNALLWVFNQLFTKVEATKPPSSRNVSAEIFVVCRGFKAPKHIDAKFLDPRAVFAELSILSPNNEARVFKPEKRKRKRDGYEAGDYTQFLEAPVSDFIETTDPIAMLGNLNRLAFKQSKIGDATLTALENLLETTSEIRQCCSDLKVLGRKEFRALLRWRSKARTKFGFSSKSDIVSPTEVEKIEVLQIDDESQIKEDLRTLTDHENARKKRTKRRVSEQKQKEISRMQLHMITPTDIGLEQIGHNAENSMFTLTSVAGGDAIERFIGCKPVCMQPENAQIQDENSQRDSDDDESCLDKDLNDLYKEYRKRKSEPNGKKRARQVKKEEVDFNLEGLSEQGESRRRRQDTDSDFNEYSDEDKDYDNISTISPMETESLVENNGLLTTRASFFFQQDIFNDIVDHQQRPDHDVFDSGDDTQGLGRENTSNEIKKADCYLTKITSTVSNEKGTSQSRAEISKPQCGEQPSNSILCRSTIEDDPHFMLESEMDMKSSKCDTYQGKQDFSSKPIRCRLLVSFFVRTDTFRYRHYHC